MNTVNPILLRTAQRDWITDSTIWDPEYIWHTYDPDAVIINGFTQDFAFLSNFAELHLHYRDGFIARSAEHIYQAEKGMDYWARKYVMQADTPAAAKYRGRQIKCRPDWEAIKEERMLEVVRYKFKHDLTYRDMLKATADAILIEANWWHDDFWGVCHCARCNGVGFNMLGQILMCVRNEIFEEEGF